MMMYLSTVTGFSGTLGDDWRAQGLRSRSTAAGKYACQLLRTSFASYAKGSLSLFCAGLKLT